MSDPISLGPFRGVNNVDPRNSAVFQARVNPEMPPPFLRAAINIDLSRQGWPQRRQGRTRILELTDGHSGFAHRDYLYLVDGGSLLRVNPDYSISTILTGLSPGRVSFCTLGDEILWSNGTQRGRIVDGEATFWGVERPRIQRLGGTAGILRPGRYQVALVGEENGVTSGARPASVIQLNSPGAITIEALCFSTQVNIYVSDADGRELFWARQVRADEFPVVLNNTSVSTELLDLFGFTAPPAGSIVRVFRGRVLVAVGNTLFFSAPLSPHLFAVTTDFQQFDSRIIMLEPLIDGFYLATETATYWVEGLEPAEWRPRLVDRRKVLEGPGLRMSGRKLEGLNAEIVYRRVSQPANEVVLWMTEDGPAFGLAGGQVQHIFDGQVAMEGGSHAAIAYRELGGIRQVLMSMQQPTGNVLAAADRVTCTVTKA